MFFKEPSFVKSGRYIFSAILFIACALILVAVAFAWPGTICWSVPFPVYFGLAPWACRLDPIASLFLLIVSFCGLAVALYSPGYIKHMQHQRNLSVYWSCLFLFVLSMAQVILAANAITFLLFWEIMALSSALLVLSGSSRHGAQTAGLIYLAATRFSTAFLTGGFILLYSLFHSWNFVDWNLLAPDTQLPMFLIFVGLCIKAGVWPFHIWLPYAHPEAPAPVSALMSGVMVKVAIYAMIRLLFESGAHGDLLGYICLALGSLSAAWGVLFALMQRDLKRLLAYSTVENVGLILMAMAITLLAKNAGLTVIASLAFSAVLFHIVNHALFKGLLFLGAGAIDIQAHTRDLSALGGLGKKMPWTMGLFFIGCLATCAMPPLNGFASKWLLYQSLFQLSFFGANEWQKGLALTLVGVLACVGALCLACFAKAFGICFLGRPRNDLVNHAREVPALMILSQALLAGLCVAFGFMGQQIIQSFLPVAQLSLNKVVPVEQFFNMPLTILSLLGLVIAVLVSCILLNRSKPPLRTYITWDCGFGDLPARTEETGSSFSQPIGRIFGSLLQYKVETEIGGKDRRHFPENITFELSMTSVLEKRLYGPLLRFFEEISRRMLALQTGSIHIYLLYVFLTLLILLGVGIRL